METKEEELTADGKFVCINKRLHKSCSPSTKKSSQILHHLFKLKGSLDAAGTEAEVLKTKT